MRGKNFKTKDGQPVHVSAVRFNHMGEPKEVLVERNGQVEWQPAAKFDLTEAIPTPMQVETKTQTTQLDEQDVKTK